MTEQKKIKTMDDYADEVVDKWIAGGRLKDLIKQAMEAIVDSAPDTIEVKVHGHGFSDEVDKPINQEWKKQMKGDK